MLYDFNGIKDIGGAFTSAGSVIEDGTARGYKSFYYGTRLDKPLEFELTFGANEDALNRNIPFDRFDLETIASWLTGRNGYKWLEIGQKDLESVRFRCIITDLKYLSGRHEPWAFTCKVSCDSPFAYTYPETFSYRVYGSLNFWFFNRSTYNGYYYPKLNVSFVGGTSINITNFSDGERVFSITGIQGGTELILNVDNENGVITNNLGINIYEHFNFNFFRLVRGDNRLEITGNALVGISCEFPVNVGG